MSAKLSKFSEPAHMSQADAIRYLQRQVFADAVAARWLAPCVRKPGRGKDSVYYATRDVKDVSLRIAAGEYPGRSVAVTVKRGPGRPCKTREATA